MPIQEIRVEMPDGRLMTGFESVHIAKPTTRRTLDPTLINGKPMTGVADESVETNPDAH